MKAARDQVVLPRLAVIEQACFSTPTPWATLENVTMMEEAVEHGGHGRSQVGPCRFPTHTGRLLDPP